MKQSFSLRVARLPKSGYCVALVAALFGVALLFSAFSFAPSAHAAVLESTTSASVNALTNQNLSQLASKDPKVHVETLTLPATSCSALQKAQPGASCQALSYSTLTVSQTVPHGGLAAVAPATWYTWSYSKWECSFISCSVWGLHLQANGITNHTAIWQYNVYCNASGLGSCTWHGYSNNGTRSIEIGLDGQACITYCIAHGMRQWINANVTLSTYYQW